MEQINIMALRHSAFYSPLLMTIAGGYLQQLGLQPRYTVQTADNTVVDNIRSGSCHLAQSAIATSFQALEQKQTLDIVHFAQINARDGFFLAARDVDENFSWSSLPGKKVLVDHFFQPMAMLKYGLHRQGIEFDDFEVIDAGDVEAMDQAFRSGLGDYVHQQGPAPQQMEHDGTGYVVAAVGEAVGPVAFSSLCASRQWLATDMARTFMQAYRQALAFVIEAPAEEIASRLQQAGFFPAIDKQVLAATLSAYQQLGCWQPDPEISTSSYESLLDVFLYSGLISRRHPFAAAVVPPPG
jgi:NitT/TauT family transport system substrate-binding protein